jgi:hypothetical protein
MVGGISFALACTDGQFAKHTNVKMIRRMMKETFDFFHFIKGLFFGR